MKAWNFKVNSSPTEIGNKLESSLGSVSGLVFNINNQQKDAVSFKVRKKILYAWYMLFQNYIIVNGIVTKSANKEAASVQVAFKLHFLMTLIILIYVLFFFGFLIMIVSGVTSGLTMYITVGVLLAAGILLWIEFQKRTKKKIQEFKTLIAEILQFNIKNSVV